MSTAARTRWWEWCAGVALIAVATGGVCFMWMISKRAQERERACAEACGEFRPIVDGRWCWCDHSTVRAPHGAAP